jgi:hypothetical protein
VVPVESPFELRHRADENPDDRPDSHSSKRRKLDLTPPSKKTYAQNLFGATLTLSAAPVSSAPRRLPGPLHRAQSGTPLPAEQDVPDNPTSYLVRQGQGALAGTSAQMEASNASAVGPTSRALQTHDRGYVPSEQERPDTEPRTLDLPRQNGTISGSRMNNPCAATRSDARPTSRTSRKPPTVADKPTTHGDSQLPPITHPTAASSVAQGPVGPELGTTLSQAIDLDVDRHSPERREERKLAPASNEGSRKQKPTKRKEAQQLAAPDVESMTTATQTKDAKELPLEERTELRLKPRQKRGLLLLSEKKNKPTQRKARDALAVEQSRSSESPGEPANPAAAEPSFGLEPAQNSSTAQPDDPFGSSPAAPRDPDSLSPPPSESEPVQGLDIGGSASTDLIPHKAGAVRTDKKRRSDESPEPQRPGVGDLGSLRDRSTGRSPSPRSIGVKSRGKISTKIDEGPSRTSNLGSEALQAGLATGSILSRSVRQTRTTKTSDDQESSRINKRVRRANSNGSAGDELPQPPARPRLARLGRKSVRSKELIGFVPSSPDRYANSALLPFGARDFEFAEDNDKAGDASLAEFGSNGSLVSNETHVETEPLTEELQPFLPSKAASHAAPVPLQRHNSLPNGGLAGGMTKVASEDHLRAATTAQLDEPSRRRSLARHASAVLPKKGKMDQNAPGVPSVPGPGGVAAPREEIAPGPKVSGRANPQPPSPLENTTLPSRLHNDSLNLLEQHAEPMNGGSDIAVDACVAEGANKQSPDAPAPGPSRPRIANPATRGRKAALKSHAAGQVPQSILPAEPASAVVSMRPPAAPRPDPAAAERPKRTMRFPGFSSARGGGPWSREAHDLLESARPC